MSAKEAFRPYIARNHFFRDMVFDFHIENETAAEWYGTSNRQTPERDWCFDHIKPGWTIIDCGAHHGMMTVFFSRCVGSTGSVIAYEPLPANAAIIEKNIALNHCVNVAIRPVGVGDRAGRFSIVYNATNTVVLSESMQYCDQSIEIVRLDDDLPADFHVDFIKIDVEGFEVRALHGMSTLLKQRPFVDLEVHNFLFAERSESLRIIRDLLEPLNYKFQLQPRPNDQPLTQTEELDTAFLASCDNPHLYCVPSERVVPVP